MAVKQDDTPRYTQTYSVVPIVHVVTSALPIRLTAALIPLPFLPLACFEAPVANCLYVGSSDRTDGI
jgi:hypothetical protein